MLDIRYSLILCTLNRANILDICLNQLEQMEYDNFEIIVIDQSDNKDSEEVIKKYDNIIYQHISEKGLSHARNIALKIMNGDYFCLIDDDGYYSKKFLRIASQNIDSNNLILSGYIMDTKKNVELVKYSSISKAYPLSLRQITRLCPSAALVMPKILVDKIGFFDEKFGVGAEYGSSEETDFLLRAYQKGFNVKYVRDMELSHPIINKGQIYIETKVNNEKQYTYAFGNGALIKKHMIYMHQISLLPIFFEIIVKKIMKLIVCNNKRYTVKQIDGFLTGFKKYR